MGSYTADSVCSYSYFDKEIISTPPGAAVTIILRILCVIFFSIFSCKKSDCILVMFIVSLYSSLPRGPAVSGYIPGLIRVLLSVSGEGRVAPASACGPSRRGEGRNVCALVSISWGRPHPISSSLNRCSSFSSSYPDVALTRLRVVGGDRVSGLLSSPSAKRSL